MLRSDWSSQFIILQGTDFSHPIYTDIQPSCSDCGQKFARNSASIRQKFARYFCRVVSREIASRIRYSLTASYDVCEEINNNILPLSCELVIYCLESADVSDSSSSANSGHISRHFSFTASSSTFQFYSSRDYTTVWI